VAVRHSEYERMPRDTYITPDWVWESLYEREPWARTAFDCCPAHGDYNFLEDWEISQDLRTNPPFNIAEKIIAHALDLPTKVWIAMLLPLGFMTARGKLRRSLFTDRRYKGFYMLPARVRWVNLPQKKSGPSTEHVVHVWRPEPRVCVPPRVGWL
jgi:hypothetical protein